MQAYRKVLEAFEGSPSSSAPWISAATKNCPTCPWMGAHPFLGNRAIRLCLANPEMFKTQLRAILRAGVSGNPWIMLPMVAILDEVRRTKELLREVEAELEAEGVQFTRDYKLGIMIEIPSAAVQADHFAQEVDFFSIGTNDLIQYTCAVDRMNQKVSYLYDPFNPAVLRLIEQVISAGHKYGKFVGMCAKWPGTLGSASLGRHGPGRVQHERLQHPPGQGGNPLLDSTRCRTVAASSAVYRRQSDQAAHGRRAEVFLVKGSWPSRNL